MQQKPLAHSTLLFYDGEETPRISTEPEPTMRHSLPRHVPLLVLLLILTTLSAPAQGPKEKPGKGPPDKTKDKPKETPKEAPKSDEPKPIAALRVAGAIFEKTKDGKAIIGANFFGSKIGDADLANLATLKDTGKHRPFRRPHHRRRPGRPQGADQPQDARPARHQSQRRRPAPPVRARQVGVPQLQRDPGRRQPRPARQTDQPENSEPRPDHCQR